MFGQIEKKKKLLCCKGLQLGKGPTDARCCRNCHGNVNDQSCPEFMAVIKQKKKKMGEEADT